MRSIRGPKKTAVDDEGHTTGLAQRGFLKVDRSGANDGGARWDNVQRKRPARYGDGRIAAGHLHGEVAGGFQILRAQTNARTDGRGSRSRSKDDFDLRLGINRRGATGRIHQVDAQLRVGVGSRKENVLLKSALRAYRGRNAAEGDVTGLDNGDGGVRDAGVVDIGESEHSNYAGGVNGGCRRGRRGRRHFRWSGVDSVRIDRTAVVASSAAGRAVGRGGRFKRYVPGNFAGLEDGAIGLLREELLSRGGRHRSSCGGNGDADAGIEINAERAGPLPVGVGGCGDRDGHVGEFGLIGKNRWSGESGRGSDGGAGARGGGERADGAICGAGTRPRRRRRGRGRPAWGWERG